MLLLTTVQSMALFASSPTAPSHNKLSSQDNSQWFYVATKGLQCPSITARDGWLLLSACSLCSPIPTPTGILSLRYHLHLFVAAAPEAISYPVCLATGLWLRWEPSGVSSAPLGGDAASAAELFLLKTTKVLISSERNELVLPAAIFLPGSLFLYFCISVFKTA